jgi:hypothetical protein
MKVEGLKGRCDGRERDGRGVKEVRFVRLAVEPWSLGRIISGM